MFPSTFSRRGSSGSNRSMGSSDYESSSSKDSDSVSNSVPSLDPGNLSEDSKFETPPESTLFDVDSRQSADTYTTTVSTFDEFDRVDNEDEIEEYERCSKFIQRPRAEPATPQEFSDLFPSTRRLIIRHDDSTLDGNMNVRVDTDAPKRRHIDRRITLFHLRMYDLRDRDFSFRRYGRDCGREVAHIKRKVTKNLPQRPALQRSVTKALHSFRGKQDQDDIKKVQRQDSGYASLFEEDLEEKNASISSAPPKPSNTCTLEFSNYAHVDLTRRGAMSSKKYDFEYWGKSYSWKRSIKTVGLSEEVSYQLLDNSANKVVAFIQPDTITSEVAAEEEAKGGFVPPCSMWLKDLIDSDHADVADVIVTTGMIALVDDCIKRKYHKKKFVQIILPTSTKSPLKMNMEYVGPKRFIDEILNRRPTVPRSPSFPSTRAASPSPRPPKRMFTG